MASTRPAWLLRDRLLRQFFGHRPYSDGSALQHASNTIPRTYTSQANSSRQKRQVKDDKDVFGTLSDSGRKLLAIKAVEHLTPDDPDGYDKEEFDLTPRKNEFYYKEEIGRHSRMGPPGLKHALELYHQMKSKDRIAPFEDVVIPLIEGCAKAGYTKKAFEVYDEWIRIRGKPSLSMITMMALSCGKCPFPKYGLERLDWFVNSIKINHPQIKFNQIHYHSIIEAYGMLGRIDKSVEILSEMVDNDFLPDTYTIQVLLMGCASQKETGLSLALRLFKRMKFFDLKPDERIYNTLARCIRDCGLGPPELLKETISELPALSTLNERLKNQEFITKITKKEQHVRDRLAWQPSIQELVDSFRKVVHASGVRKFDQPIALVDNSPTNESPSQRALMKRVEIQEKEKALSLEFERLPLLTSSHKYPNLLSDDHLVLLSRIQSINMSQVRTRSGKLSLFGDLHGFLEAMTKDNCKPTRTTFMLLLQCLERDPVIYLEFLRLAQDYKINMDAYFFDHLIEAICQNFRDRKRRDLATQIMDEMAARNIKPTILTYESLAYSCDTWKQAEKLIDDVKNCGCVVGLTMIAKLFRCATHRQDFLYLNNLFQLGWEHKFKPTKSLIEKIEEIRLNAEELLLKNERGELRHDESIDEQYLSEARKFTKKSARWLDAVTVHNPHPWAQYETESGSRRDGFQKFEVKFRKLLNAKHKSMKQGKFPENIAKAAFAAPEH